MQLVLLSGGSGKRLWPLSDNVRSKQFLPLIEKEDGTMESMVQRVVRQAKEIMQINAITIATNASQIDIITQQLGDTISIVTVVTPFRQLPSLQATSNSLKAVITMR